MKLQSPPIAKRTAAPVVTFPHSKRLGKKLIVPDTSVPLHDPESLFKFKENDVIIVRQVLAQLDRHKKGQTDVARSARQVTRTLDALFKGDRHRMEHGAPLAEASNASASGSLFFQVGSLTYPLPKDLLDDDADRRIIAAACALRRMYPAYDDVVLVTKDANMRYAALSVKEANIKAEDYLSDRALVRDSDILPKGLHALPEDFWETHECVRHTGSAIGSWLVRGPVVEDARLNECMFIPRGDDVMCVKVREKGADSMVVEQVINHGSDKHAVWGVTARNREQAIALSHLMDPQIDLVMLLGDAGTGKTLCALAAGFEHLSKRGGVHAGHPAAQLIMTRAMVPVGGEELGYLPGDIKDKFGPWMVAMSDTQQALIHNAITHSHWNKTQAETFQDRIHVQPIGLIAGRTLAESFVIVDEAQNLTPYQAKMLVTRAGEGAKFVFCGNLSQIDTPFLNERSSGLAYLVMRLRGQSHVAHVILEECVRSRLAKLAVEML